MPYILNIDTSGEHATICLANGDAILAISANTQQKEHASWLLPAINGLMEKTGMALKDLDAVAVTSGPGSYTGLRVGLATAKGLCYGLGLPLITVNTLEAMTVAGLDSEADLICPMIDARRMEVYAGIYDKELRVILPPTAMLLDVNSFSDYLEKKKIIFFGTGKEKFQKLCNHRNAVFKNLHFDSSLISRIANQKFNFSDFTDLAYSQPEYLKEFYRTN